MCRMFFAVVFAVLAPKVISQCTFPAEIQGRWSSAFEDWTDLTISASSIEGMKPDFKTLDFSCFQSNGSTYVIKSETFSVSTFQFNYYVCLDIAPSAATDILYYRVRTHPEPTTQNFTVVTYQSTQEVNITEVCHKDATQVPLHYDIFFARGFESDTQTNRCPRDLHAEFAANFTETANQASCPEGFTIDGCNSTSHLLFNYSMCSGDQNGSPQYTCATSMEVGNTTYTTIYLPPADPAAQINAYQISCLEQTMMDGELAITKSAGVCGGMTSVAMVANETVSCRAATTPMPETTEAGRNASTQAPPAGSTLPGNGGSGAVGDGNTASTILSGFSTFLVAMVFAVLTNTLP